MSTATFKLIPPVLVVLALGIAGYAVHLFRTASLVPVSSGPEMSTRIDLPARETIPENAWDVFDFTGDQPVGAKSDRYRLAGTFFIMGVDESASERQRLAIIDDIASNQQHMVREGQTFQDHEIVRIFQDRLIMRRDAVEVELTLSFQEVLEGSKPSAPSETQKTDSVLGQEVLESNRFGKRIGEKRWVIDKRAIVGYYQELLDNPERIAAVYMSMKPAYDSEGSVGGYTLQKEGEKEFFDAVGLLEGDTIRKVNSMRMTSQKRAEYFIGEFMKERLGAVVLDIEREGKPEKLIYLFR